MLAEGGSVKYFLGFRFALACYFCYIGGGFLSAFLVVTNNRVGAALAVLIPTICIGIVISVDCLNTWRFLAR